MLDLGKFNLLGVRVSAVDYDAAVHAVITAESARRNLTVSALAVHGVMTGVLDRSQRHRLNRLDLVVPDGQPVRWGLNVLHGLRIPERVYGPTLMWRVCEEAARRQLPVYLYGSRPDVLDALVSRLQKRFPALLIAGLTPSKFRRLSLAETDAVVQEILDSGAAIVFVGLGCPRQEVWLYEHRTRLPMPLVAVGAAFDFHAGLLAQAPPMLQRVGLEWAFRLVHEPVRLWHRYVLLNPLYILLLLLQWTRLAAFDTDDAGTQVQFRGDG